MVHCGAAAGGHSAVHLIQSAGGAEMTPAALCYRLEFALGWDCDDLCRAAVVTVVGAFAAAGIVGKIVERWQ